MATSAPLMETNWSRSISSAEDSPARTSARPESGPASRALARAFGLSSPVWFGNLDLSTCSLRTCQGSLFTTECEELSETWPDAGMWDAGSVYELRTSELPTCGSASSSWPTATLDDAKSSGSAAYSTESGRHSGTTLTDAIRMWPTASSCIANDGETPETWEARRQQNLAKGYNGNGQGTPLTIAAMTWPTPEAASGGR